MPTEIADHRAQAQGMTDDAIRRRLTDLPAIASNYRERRALEEELMTRSLTADQRARDDAAKAELRRLRDRPPPTPPAVIGGHVANAQDIEAIRTIAAEVVEERLAPLRAEIAALRGMTQEVDT